MCVIGTTDEEHDANLVNLMERAKCGRFSVQLNKMLHQEV